MSKLYNYFEKLHKENKIVQAYLIGNTKYDEISNEMQEIINNFFFSDESNTINVDIQVVRSEKGTISKDSIKNIIENVTKTSQFNNKKIYIIDEAELLNDYSYNAILKTLEEPQSNVYAFLITKNMESVKPTISSRCQKIFISNSDNYEIEEDNSISEELFNSLEAEGLATIYKKYEFYSKIQDRNELLNILNTILKKYDNLLNNAADNNSIELIGRKILIINDIITSVNGNLNKNLCIDRLIIEIWRCNNEDSRN